MELCLQCISLQIFISVTPFSSQSDKPVINIYDMSKVVLDKDTKLITPSKTLSSLHRATITLIKYNELLGFVVSADKSGMIEYWSAEDYQFPSHSVSFSMKLDTDLFSLVKVY